MHGSSGVIITWMDYRAGNRDIFAQRLNASGTSQWVTDGVAVCTADNSQENPAIVTDGAGGAVIAWEDPRPTSQAYDIFAQRLTSTGAGLWTSNGVGVCSAVGNQGGVQLVGDGSGGAIVTWDDNRASDIDLYAQRISAQGGLYITGVETRTPIKAAIHLSQNSPNPFNPYTTIRFHLPYAGDVRLDVFDVVGRRVSRLVSQRLAAGDHMAHWGGLDERGHRGTCQRL